MIILRISKQSIGSAIQKKDPAGFEADSRQLTSPPRGLPAITSGWPSYQLCIRNRIEIRQLIIPPLRGETFARTLALATNAGVLQSG